MALTKKEQAILSLILIALLSLIIIAIEIQIAIIHFHQSMFWISLFLAPFFFLLFIIFLIWGIMKENTQQDYWGYYQEEFFEKPTIFIFAIGFIVLCFIAALFVPYHYERGYSNESLEKLANLENQLQSLQQIRSIFTGEIVWEIGNQAIEETINNLCEDPNYPCEQSKQSFEIYKQIKGKKDDADNIARFFGFANKVTKTLDNKE